MTEASSSARRKVVNSASPVKVVRITSTYSPSPSTSTATSSAPLKARVNLTSPYSPTTPTTSIASLRPRVNSSRSTTPLPDRPILARVVSYSETRPASPTPSAGYGARPPTPLQRAYSTPVHNNNGAIRSTPTTATTPSSNSGRATPTFRTPTLGGGGGGVTLSSPKAVSREMLMRSPPLASTSSFRPASPLVIPTTTFVATGGGEMTPRTTQRSLSFLSNEGSIIAEEPTEEEMEKATRERQDREINERRTSAEREEKEARVRRKVLDLEITNTSLLAINSSLESLKVRNRDEIRSLRRRLRESRTMPTYSSLRTLPDEGKLSSCSDDDDRVHTDDDSNGVEGERDDDDDAEEEVETSWEDLLLEDAQFAHIAMSLHSLVQRAEKAIAFTVEKNDTMGRVLHSSEMYSHSNASGSIRGMREMSQELSGRWDSPGISEDGRNEDGEEEEEEQTTIGLGISAKEFIHKGQAEGEGFHSEGMRLAMEAYPSPPTESTGVFLL